MHHFAKNVNDTFAIIRFQMTWTKNDEVLVCQEVQEKIIYK